jgi:hypothetical protein
MVSRIKSLVWIAGFAVTVVTISLYLVRRVGLYDRTSVTGTKLSHAVSAALIYRQEHGMFPTNVADIVSIMLTSSVHIVDETWFNAKGQLLDVWGRPVRLKLENDGYTIVMYSLGKNGVDDGGSNDDIVESFALAKPRR